MISGVEWIPKGVADPNPKKYELSKAEREILEKQAHELQEELQTREEESEEEDDNSDNMDTANQKESDSGDNGMTASEIIASQQVDPSSLPSDLRMDDYSDTEDATDNDGEAGIGDLLIGHDSAGIGVDENGNIDDDANVDDDDSDSDSDEELAEIPDTREFMPTDIKGLESMTFGGYNGMADYADEEGSVDGSDVEDTNLKADDALVIVAKTEEEFASLEVHVYEENTGNLFVHHDIPLPAYPLCLSHGTINSSGEAGNFIAVGTFNPGIEVWNLDVLDALEPTCILGGEDTSAADAEWASKVMGDGSSSSGSKKKKRQKKKKSVNQGGGLRAGSHSDAVMSLSWNSTHRQVIASGSADKTIKIWDITRANDATGGIAATYTHHSDKIEALAWHPTEGSILASGSYDRTVSITDVRSSSTKKAKLPADCEAVAWDPHQPHLLTAVSEDGSILCWDVRKFESGITYWNFVAHEFGGCSDISYNPNVPGMLASCAVDKTVALWDTRNVQNNPNEQPFSCGSKDMKAGKLYTVSFYPSSPSLLACGGAGGQLALWDLSNEEKFQKRFGNIVQNGSENSTAMGNDSGKAEDFEAMMAAGDQAAAKALENATNGKKKKRKPRKKAHKKGR